MAEAVPHLDQDRRVYFAIAACVVVLAASFVLLGGTVRSVLVVVAAYWLLWRLVLLFFRGRRRPPWILLVPVAVGLVLSHWAAPALAVVHSPPLIAMFGPRRDYQPTRIPDREPLWRGIVIVTVIEAFGLAVGVGLARLIGLPTLL